jgi:phosphoribosylanthranilate isomerase
MRDLKRIVQVAGVGDDETARMLVDCGVIYLGFPLRVPEHSLSIPEDKAARIISTLPPDAMPVLITYIDNAKETIGFCDYLGVKGVQVHGDMPVDEFKMLKEMRPDLLITKSLVIGRMDFERTLEEMRICSPWADLFITDTYDPATGRCGATGIAHDWELSKKIVELSPRPVILAGGLNPSNVRRAINEVRPAGVDAHTGLDRNGRKDRELVTAFMREAGLGFDDIGLR